MSNKYFGGVGRKTKVSLNRLMKTSKHLHWLFRGKVAEKMDKLACRRCNDRK